MPVVPLREHVLGHPRVDLVADGPAAALVPIHDALPRGSADGRAIEMAQKLDLPAMSRIVLEDVVHGPADAQDPLAPVGTLPRDLLVHLAVRYLGPGLPDEGAPPGQQILVKGERLVLEVGRPLRIRSE